MNRSDLRDVFGRVLPLDGFHQVERDVWGSSVWSKGRFRLRRTPGDQGKLYIKHKGVRYSEIDLRKGWNTYPLETPDSSDNEIECELSDVIPVPGDSRQLGLMIRRMRSIGTAQFNMLERVLENKTLNEREYAEGRSKLESHPILLVLSTSNRCNTHPPCVYCDWEKAKLEEAASGFVFRYETLDALGDFYALSEWLEDNTRGEPFNNPEIVRLITRVDNDSKQFGLTSNGTLLGPTIRSLLGKQLVLSVSVDSASAEGYARYRDHRFDLVIRNLRELCAAKKDHGDLPVVIVPFIAMRSNHTQVSPFLKLMKKIGVNCVKLRYLYFDPFLQKRTILRNGFLFDYDSEMLRSKELKDLTQDARLKAGEIGIDLLAEEDLGSEEEPLAGSLCSHPWKLIHVLNRGIFACCYGMDTPIASWQDRGNRTVEEFLEDVWNGDRYMHLRAKLSKREFPGHCKQNMSCPIVRRHSDR